MAHRDRGGVASGGTRVWGVLLFFPVRTFGRHDPRHCSRCSWIWPDVDGRCALVTEEEPSPAIRKASVVDASSPVARTVELSPDIVSRYLAFRPWPHAGPYVGSYSGDYYRCPGRLLATFHATIDDSTCSDGVNLQQHRCRIGKTQKRC